MIIPQISENLTRSHSLEIPKTCPVCGGATEIVDEAGVRTLYCTNPECAAKQIKSFELFVGRNAMNVDGLSEMTLEKFIDEGFIKTFADLFRINQHREKIVSMEGFGEKSFDNLMTALENARHTTLARVLFALGIPGIGVAGGKLLAKYFKNDLNLLRQATEEDFTEIEGIGSVMAHDIYGYFQNEKKMEELDDLLKELVFEEEASEETQIFEGKTFVITGSLNTFENRDEMKDFIEKRGGKVAGSVSKNTDYLINNDVLSNSSKNKKAKELSVPIISEEDFRNML